MGLTLRISNCFPLIYLNPFEIMSANISVFRFSYDCFPPYCTKTWAEWNALRVKIMSANRKWIWKSDTAFSLSGARKWQVPIEMEADAFHNALLNIYPRLAGVTSYTLWTINKHKEFEKLPVKVNTPKRFRSYLGSQYSGCLIIMPNEEIPLVSTSTYKASGSVKGFRKGS